MEVLFWVALIVAANWTLTLIRVLINPEWYHDKAAQAGVSGNTKRFIIVKLTQLALCASVLFWAGEQAGYF